MERILPSSDWLLSGQDGSLLPAQDFSVCFHKWISNVISSLIWIIRIYFRRKIVKHTVHRLRAVSLFLQLLVRSVHSRQSVERRTRSVVARADKGTFVSRAFRSTDYEGETARSLHSAFMLKTLPYACMWWKHGWNNILQWLSITWWHFHCRTCVFWIKTSGDKVLKVELKQRSHGTRRIVD